MDTALDKYRKIILNYVSNTLTSENFTQFNERSILKLIEKLNEIERTLEIEIFDSIKFKKDLDGIECSFSLKTLSSPLNLIRWQSFFGTPASFKKEVIEAICDILLKMEEKQD